MFQQLDFGNSVESLNGSLNGDLNAVDPLPNVTFADIATPWYLQWYGMAGIGIGAFAVWKLWLEGKK